MKRNLILNTFLLLVLWQSNCYLQAQNVPVLTLAQLTDSALVHNRLLQIKSLQGEEIAAKIKEARIKKYPALQLNSTYQYNVNVGQLIIPQGSFGVLPLSPSNNVALPSRDEHFQLGKHHVFNVGVSVYQPISQQGKINTGIDLIKNEIQVNQIEKQKAAQQIKLGVEKLYYGLLINQKQREEIEAKIALAELRIYDLESALISGKTIEANKAGLLAMLADEEQNLLKNTIQQEDYMDDLRRLTGIQLPTVEVAEFDLPALQISELSTYQASAGTQNVDVQLASLQTNKAQLGLRAAQQSYLPDLGILAGYTYQQGNVIFPASNPFVGVNLKWSLQDILTNKHVIAQRKALIETAQTNLLNTQDEIERDISKAYRKIKQSERLISVAEKAVRYREEELKVQQDKALVGLNVQADLLQIQALLAKAKADLYTAQLAYHLATSELTALIGE